MIANKRISESKRFLEKAIDYNKKIQNKLKKLVDKSKSNFNSGWKNDDEGDDFE